MDIQDMIVQSVKDSKEKAVCVSDEAQIEWLKHPDSRLLLLKNGLVVKHVLLNGELIVCERSLPPDKLADFVREQEISQLTKFMINLIREHFEPSSENAFLETSRQVSKYLRRLGKEQLAVYIDCLNGDEENVWVPM